MDFFPWNGDLCVGPVFGNMINFKPRQSSNSIFVAHQMNEHLHRLMFGKEMSPLLKLAMKIADGARTFTAEELQLQENEAEELERVLRELRDWEEKLNGT
jgi:hypothetical protein